MKYVSIVLFVIHIVCSASAFAQQDVITKIQVQEKIGLTETPLVLLSIEVSKPRELFIAVQNMQTWKTVAKSRNTIEVSNNYNVEMPIKDMLPGRYRIDAYLAPKGKDFKSKLAEPIRTQMVVINEPIFALPLKLGDEDKVKQVQFPKIVTGSEDVTLTLKYTVKGTRDLRVRLLSSQDWKEFGSLKFPVKESGEMSVPLVNMIDDFPAGKYAWVVTITEPGKTEELAKMGKHFELVAE